MTQITSNMISNKTFYTDSSGRDFIERVCYQLTLITNTWLEDL